MPSASCTATTWAGSAKLHVARQASTVTFLLIVAGQMGTLMACRSRFAPFWSRLRVDNGLFWIGVLSEPVVAGLLVLLPALAAAFGLSPLPLPWLGWLGWGTVAVLLADTLYKRWLGRQSRGLRPSQR